MIDIKKFQNFINSIMKDGEFCKKCNFKNYNFFNEMNNLLLIPIQRNNPTINSFN